MKREKPKLHRSHFPLIHFLIMYNQYTKLLDKLGYRQFPSALKKVMDKRRFHKQTRGIYRCSKLLKARYGKEICRKVQLFSTSSVSIRAGDCFVESVQYSID